MLELVKQFLKDCSFVKTDNELLDKIHNDDVPLCRFMAILMFLLSSSIVFFLLYLGFKAIIGFLSVLFISYIIYKFCTEYGKPKQE